MTTTNIYKEVLSNEDINHLKGLVGKKIYQFFSPNLTVESDNKVTTMSLSCSNKEIWCNFSNLWKETANDFTYHKLLLKVGDIPENIKYIKEERSLINVNSIAIPANESVIKKIEIYSIDDSKEAESEEVFYDYGLVFYYENGYKFCISVYEESIADELQLIRDADQIKERLKEAHLRHVIE